MTLKTSYNYTIHEVNINQQTKLGGPHYGDRIDGDRMGCNGVYERLGLAKPSWWKGYDVSHRHSLMVIYGLIIEV